MSDTRLVDDITIGHRHRKSVGDIASLAASIERDGLLHPTVITPDGKLIAGERRIRACELLGWTHVPVRIVNLDNVTRGELAENVEREPFLPSEIEAIRRTLEPIEKAAATSRKFSGRSSTESGETRDKIGAFAGISGRTVEKIAAVCAAAEAEPEKFGKLVEDMDRKGNVDRAFKFLKAARGREAYEQRQHQGGTVKDLQALAASGFRASAILVDPPWEFRVWSDKGKGWSAAEDHFDTMPLDKIKSLPVAALAADDCMLFLWTTWPTLFEAGELIRAWGFTYSTAAFVYVKQKESGAGLHMGMGYYTRANSEPCLLATRGSPLRLAFDVSQVILAPLGAHSAKPNEAHARIERLVAGPYLELFARQERPGWTTWGDEVPPPRSIPAEQGELPNGKPDTEFRYVRHETVEQFTAEGWSATEGLTGTHHGDYAVLMQRPAPLADDYPELPECLRRT